MTFVPTIVTGTVYFPSHLSCNSSSILSRDTICPEMHGKEMHELYDKIFKSMSERPSTKRSRSSIILLKLRNVLFSSGYVHRRFGSAAFFRVAC